MAKPMKNGAIAQKPKYFKLTLLKLMVNLKSQAVQIILSLLFAGLSTVLSILGPNELQKIGQILYSGNLEFSKITKIAIGLLIIYACSFIFSFFQSFIMSGVTSRLSKDFRNKLSEKIKKCVLLTVVHTFYYQSSKSFTCFLAIAIKSSTFILPMSPLPR